MSSLVEQLQTNTTIDIESPFKIEIESVVYTFDCLIHGYGAEKGMLIYSNAEKFSSIGDVLIELGYGYSCFDIFNDTSSYVEFVEEVLIGDWGANVI